MNKLKIITLLSCIKFELPGDKMSEEFGIYRAVALNNIGIIGLVLLTIELVTNGT